MGHKLSIVFLLFAVSVTTADDSAYNEAANRLASKSTAATRPAGDIISENYQLRQDNASLRRQVAELRAMVTKLQAGLAAPKMPATEPIQQPATATPGEVEVGMAEAGCDRIAIAKHWTKVVTEKATDGTGIEYRSPVGWSSGFREKDVCWFVDGKLVRVELIRVPRDGGRGEQVGPFIYGHGR